MAAQVRLLSGGILRFRRGMAMRRCRRIYRRCRSGSRTLGVGLTT